MALADGDYIKVEEKVVATLEADTGAGGLFETGDPAVKLIEAELRQSLANYKKQELPAMVACVLGDVEEAQSNARNVDKIFAVEIVIVDRLGAEALAVASVQKIASRAKTVFRDQTKTANQFQQLPAVIEGAEGALITTLPDTKFNVGKADTKASGEWAAQAIITGVIRIECSYAFE